MTTSSNTSHTSIRKQLWVLAWLVSILFLAQPAVAQQCFPKQIPPGNYSGICTLGGGLYAVVDDKAKEDGFYIFHLSIDTLSHRILAAENRGYRSSGHANRDMEGICFCPATRTLFISGEADNEVYEYSLGGERTGRRLPIPAIFKKARKNLGLEALTYDTFSQQFLTTTERPLPGDSLLRIQAFDNDLRSTRQYLYRLDKPKTSKYYYGVSELCATGDGRLLVLERQVHVTKMRLNSQSIMRIYEVYPADNTFLNKRLVKEWSTKLTLTGFNFANYEGMCALSPQQFLLIADSQNQLKGVLRDWFLQLTLPSQSVIR